jgi:type III pantothenate kinase
MRAKAMHQFTEKLPYLNWRDMRLDGSFGFQTDQNLYHGILTAVKYELSGFISDYLTKYPNGLIVFTGGDANVHFPFFSTDKIMLELNLLWYGMLQFSPLKNV